MQRELPLRLGERHNDHTYSVLQILLIENNPAADKIRAALAAAGSGSFDVEWVRQLSEGLARLSKEELTLSYSSCPCPIVAVLRRSTSCSASRPTSRFWSSATVTKPWRK